jgi:hypothetical protein
MAVFGRFEPVSEGHKAGPLAIAVNLAIRLSIVYFAYDSIAHPHDPRYEGKGLAFRDVVVLLLALGVIPFLHFIWNKWERYPYWFDAIYLSMFWTDMAGNYFNLYNTFEYYDLLPHFHGPGSVAIAIRGLSELSPFGAFLGTNLLHGLLELQENLGDLLFGTHNVNGIGDTLHDLGSGLAGSVIYLALYHWAGEPGRTAKTDRH